MHRSHSTGLAIYNVLLYPFIHLILSTRLIICLYLYGRCVRSWRKPKSYNVGAIDIDIVITISMVGAASLNRDSVYVATFNSISSQLEPNFAILRSHKHNRRRTLTFFFILLVLSVELHSGSLF